MFTILVIGIHQDSVNECVVASVSNSTVEKCQPEQVPPAENCTRAYKNIKKLAKHIHDTWCVDGDTKHVMVCHAKSCTFDFNRCGVLLRTATLLWQLKLSPL